MSPKNRPIYIRRAQHKSPTKEPYQRALRKSRTKEPYKRAIYSLNHTHTTRAWLQRCPPTYKVSRHRVDVGRKPRLLCAKAPVFAMNLRKLHRYYVNLKTSTFTGERTYFRNDHKNLNKLFVNVWRLFYEWVRVYICRCVCVCVCVCAYVNVHIHASTSDPLHYVFVYMYVCVSVCVRVYVCVYTHT